MSSRNISIKQDIENDHLDVLENGTKATRVYQDENFANKVSIYAITADISSVENDIQDLKSDVKNDQIKSTAFYNIKTEVLSPEMYQNEVEIENSGIACLKHIVKIKQETDDTYLHNQMLVCELTVDTNGINNIKVEESPSEIVNIGLHEKVEKGKHEFVSQQACKEEILSVRNAEIVGITAILPVSNKCRRQREIFKCLQCKYTTTYKSDLKNHTNTHFQVKAYICGICNKRYKRQDAVNFHMNYMHSDIAWNRIYQCSLCEYKTNIKPYLQCHISKKHCKIKKYECPKCSYKTAYSVSLKRHLDTHETVKQLNCSMCEYATNSKYRFKLHSYKHEMVKRYKCIKCDYATHHKYRLTEHFFNNHREEKRFQCLKCEYKTNFNSNLKKHAITMHCEGEVEKIKCPECDYVASNKHRIKEHFTNKHTTVKRFQCIECEYATNNKSNLKNHINAKHSKGNKYQCPKCEYQAGYKCSLKKHLLSHDEMKRFKCSECDFKTKYEASLRDHINAIHREIKKFKCLTCDYETAYRTSLKNHLYLHDGMKQFRCSECEFETNYNSHLKVHVKKKHK